MTRRDWNLLAIAAAEGRPLTPAQLQKSLFLFENAYPQEMQPVGYGFQPYHYGPFASGVYDDAESHATCGLVHIERTSWGWSQYSATPTGLIEARRLEGMAPVEPLSYLRAVVTWARSLSFEQLVRAIYDKFPAYREKSVFRY